MCAVVKGHTKRGCSKSQWRVTGTESTTRWLDIVVSRRQAVFQDNVTCGENERMFRRFVLEWHGDVSIGPKEGRAILKRAVGGPFETQHPSRVYGHTQISEDDRVQRSGAGDASNGEHRDASERNRHHSVLGVLPRDHARPGALMEVAPLW